MLGRIGRGAPETTRVTLHPGDRIEKDLVLPAAPERLLRGEVVEADGTPSAQAFASLLVAGELQRVTSTDEVSQLSEAVNQMVDRTSEALRSIAENATSLASSSGASRPAATITS